MAANASAAAGGMAATAAEERMDPRRLVAFFAMVFGMFMSILDIQIVSASLAEIQAGLGAGSEEVAWVQTSYLIAEVIMIPAVGRSCPHPVDTRAVFRLCRRLYACQRACGDGDQHRPDDHIPGHPGLYRRGMIPPSLPRPSPSSRHPSAISSRRSLAWWPRLLRPSAPRSEAISATPCPGTGCS